MNICVACVVGAHGVKGYVKIEPFMRDPRDLWSYQSLMDDDGRACVLRLVRFLPKRILLCEWGGICSREDAQKMRGTRLYVDRTHMPYLDDDTYYYADLVGLNVVSIEDGSILGCVTAVHDYGAGAFFDIATNVSSCEMTLPFYKEASVDLGSRVMRISPSWLVG